MEQGIRCFLEGMGRGLDDSSGDDLRDTPARVARAWCEDLISGYAVDPLSTLTWSAVEAGAGPVLVRRVRFSSICVHHLLPFFGCADVAYLPGVRLAGLSKIGRVIDAHSRRLQTQEQLTQEIVNTLQAGLEPSGAIAVLRAEHTCMTVRGVRKDSSRMVTMAFSGLYREGPAARREILALLQVSDPENDG